MLQRLTFRPGINRETTTYATEGGWWDMDKVRFRFGTPEKIGGWRKAAEGSYEGVARSLICWSTMTGEVIIGVGTNLRYYVNYAGAYNNITPIRKTETLANPFFTTINSSIVRVTAANNGVQPGDMVIFSGAELTGGINSAVLNRLAGHQVLSVVDSNNYTIDVGSIATSTTQGGGASVFTTYEITAGRSVFTVGAGWGAGFWNGPITGTATTTLAGTGRSALNATDTTITVQSTTGFSNAGTLVIESEIITYTGITSTTFTGCSRGQLQTTAAAHNRRQLNATEFAPVEVKQVTGFAGENGYGEGTDTSFGVGSQLRLWSVYNFGEDLVLASRGGGLFYWTKDLLNYSRAVSLRNASDSSTVIGPHDPADPDMRFVPHTVGAMVVSDVSRFVIAFGANPYDPGDPDTDYDPMLVRWSDQNRPDIWAPHSTNQSGEQHLSSGSYIMNAVNMKQEILIWTDAALYSMQYIGPPFVWSFQLSMSNLSLMGPNAVAVVNNNAYWMGTDKFYIYSGRVDTLPCTISQHIFNDISFSQRFQAFAGSNEGFNEIWWFYVSNTEVSNATQEGRDPTIDKYVVFNHAENCWYFGSLSRAAWLDTPLFPGPLATTGEAGGTLVMHEQGTDDGTTGTPTALRAYIQSSDFDVGDGHQFLFVWRMLPDVSFNGSIVANPSCTITLKPRQNQAVDYQAGDPTTVTSGQTFDTVHRQYTVQQFTSQINTRVRGRAMAFRIESDKLGVQWKLGTPRIDARPDGRKS